LVLQYSLLLFIYYFLFRMVRFGYLDLQGRRTNPIEKRIPSVRNSLAKLTVINAGTEQLAQTDYVIHEGLTIGRNQNNTIILEDPFISYEHACISRCRQDYILTDLNSTNGTFVNGNKIEDEFMLNPGDEIRMGVVTFRFER
jgi:pSer/pThr/pTyr-binding forkhead associated (FHA) protein